MDFFNVLLLISTAIIFTNTQANPIWTILVQETNDSCYAPPVNVTNPRQSYGWMDQIYDISQQLCDDLQAKENDQYFKDLGDIYEKISDGGFNPNEIVSFGKKQIGAIVFIIIGAIIFAGIPISGILFCYCRYCCKCGAKRKHRPSKIALVIWLLLLLIGITFVLPSMIIYSFSVQNTADNVDNVTNTTNSILNDVESILTSAANNINCEINETLGTFFDEVIDIIDAMPNQIFDSFEKKYGYNDIKKIIDDNNDTGTCFSSAIAAISNASESVMNLSNMPWSDPLELRNVTIELQALNISLNKVNEPFNKVYSQLNETFHDVDNKIKKAKEKVRSSISGAQKSIKEAHDNIEEVSSNINTTVNEIKNLIHNLTNDLQGIQKNIDSSPAKNGVIQGAKALVLVPCALVLIPAIIAFICGAIRLPMDDSRPSKRSMVFNCAGCLAMTGAFLGFLLGWIVILVALLSFIGGFSTEMICHPLFHDPEMRIFNYIPFFNFSVPPIYGNTSTVIGFGDVLKSCHNDSSIFAALKGDTLMNTSEILKQANLEDYKQQAVNEFKNQNLTYSVNGTNSAELKNATDDLGRALKHFQTELNKTRQKAGNDPDKIKKVHETEDRLAKAKEKIANIINKTNTTVSNVSHVIDLASSSGSFAEAGEKTITKVFNDTIKNVADKIKTAKSQLNDTYDCYPLYEVWNATGITLCEVISLPLQGLWVSSSLAGVFLIVLIVGLILTAKYLQRMSPESDRVLPSLRRFGKRSISRVMIANQLQFTAFRRPSFKYPFQNVNRPTWSR